MFILSLYVSNHTYRYIFFSKSDEGNYLLLAKKLKEDRKQLRTLSSVLHMPEERASEIIVGHGMIDFAELAI